MQQTGQEREAIAKSIHKAATILDGASDHEEVLQVREMLIAAVADITAWQNPERVGSAER